MPWCRGPDPHHRYDDAASAPAPWLGDEAGCAKGRRQETPTQPPTHPHSRFLSLAGFKCSNYCENEVVAKGGGSRVTAGAKGLGCTQMQPSTPLPVKGPWVPRLDGALRSHRSQS